MLSTRFTNFMGLLLVGLLLVVISPVASYGAFIIKLPQAQKYCFFETLKKGDRFDMSFVTTSEGEQAIKFWMNDPSGNRLHGVERESSSSFGFNPEAQGNYEFCFDNGVTHGDKEITFTVYGPEEHAGFGKDFEKHDGMSFSTLQTGSERLRHKTSGFCWRLKPLSTPMLTMRTRTQQP